VEVRYYSHVRHLFGEERLEAVKIEDTETGECEALRTPALFSFVGHVPPGSTKRVSSAVGEGAMAIRYVHEFLAATLAEQDA
jgi:hypothetical protein